MLNHKSLLHEAISEITVVTNMYKTTCNPRIVGDFLAYLALCDKKSAKLLWDNTVRARVYSCAMEQILVEEIDDYLNAL